MSGTSPEHEVYEASIDLLTKALNAANLAMDVLLKANEIARSDQPFFEHVSSEYVPPTNGGTVEPTEKKPTRADWYNELSGKSQETDLVLD